MAWICEGSGKVAGKHICVYAHTHTLSLSHTHSHTHTHTHTQTESQIQTQTQTQTHTECEGCGLVAGKRTFRFRGFGVSGFRVWGLGCKV